MDAAHCASASLGRRAISGQQIGTIVGGIVGAFFGAPQLGAFIGGAIGGYLDPTQVQGPRLTDGMTVTAKDGIPNPWGFGTFSVGANVIWTADLQEHSHTDDGKGSGVEQETFTYTRSYALGICRAKREEDGTYSDIAGILRVTHNNKVVYNTQPDATTEQLANNSKFLENHKFYLGGEAQQPDPTIESYLGVGNVSAYRGQVLMVATDEDQTELQGAIGTWEFVVSMEAEAEPEVQTLNPGRLARFVNALFPLPDSEDSYTYTGAMEGVPGTFTADTIQEVISHFTTLDREPTQYMGYSAETSPITSDGFGYDLATWGVSNFVEQPDITHNAAIKLVYSEFVPEIFIDEIFLTNACSLVSGEQYVQSRRGEIGREFDSDPGGTWGLANAECGLYGHFPLAIHVTPKRIGPLIPPEGATSIPDAPGYYITSDGEIGGGYDYEEDSGDYYVLSTDSPFSLIDDREQYTYFEQGPALELGDPNNTEEFWTPYYEAAVLAGTLPVGLSYGVDYPVAISSVWIGTPSGAPLLAVEGVLLGQIIAEICRRCGLSGDDIDVSELTDVVDGFKVAVETTGETIISSLMPAFFFDCGEWDDKLRFIKRGGDAVFALTPEDMAERDGPAIEETEAQEVELLRKVHVRAMDPAAGYVETTQTAERRSSTVAADGEQTLALPVVMDKDTQAQVAEKRIKVAWAEPRRFKWTLPYTRPELTPTDVGTITDRKGRTQRIRLMEMTEDGGLIQIEEAMLDRQSAYTSDVEGVVHNPPTDTSPGLIGPTFGVPMNLPSLRTQDNTPGAYIAACGYLSGWRACAVLLSVDGGESFSQVMTISQPSRMGVLTADVTDSSEPIEVFMNSGEISSITDAQLAARGNAWAITSDFSTLDAVSEIGQSKTANLTSSGGYDLTENVRGGLGTDAAPHYDGDPFVMLSSVYFLPLDISLAGQVLYFKFVSYGTSSDEAEEIPFLFNPIFTTVTIEPYTDDSGNIYTDDSDNIYYYEAVS